MTIARFTPRLPLLPQGRARGGSEKRGQKSISRKPGPTRGGKGRKEKTGVRKALAGSRSRSGCRVAGITQTVAVGVGLHAVAQGRTVVPEIPNAVAIAVGWRVPSGG